MAGEGGRFEPVVIRYDGLDADQHLVELGALGESLRGASKLIGVAGNLALTGRYVKKAPALAVRVYARPAQPSSFEIAATLATTAPFLPYLGGAASKLLEIFVNLILAKLSGKKDEMDRLAGVAQALAVELGATARQAQELLAEAYKAADGQRAAARQFVRPIGETVATARIGVTDASTPVDRAAKEVIDGDNPIEITPAREMTVRLTELDLQTKACKVSIQGDDDEAQRYPCEIVDPVLSVPGNKYSAALHSQAWLVVTAKAHIRDGDIERLTITDAK